MFYCTFSSRSPHSNTQDKRRKSEPRSDTQSQRHSRTRCRYVETDISFPFSSRLDREDSNSRRSNHRFTVAERNSSFLNFQTSSNLIDRSQNKIPFSPEKRNESTPPPTSCITLPDLHQELSFPFSFFFFFFFFLEQIIHNCYPKTVTNLLSSVSLFSIMFLNKASSRKTGPYSSSLCSNTVTRNQSPPYEQRKHGFLAHYVVDGEVGTEIGDVGLIDSLPFDSVGVEALYSLWIPGVLVLLLPSKLSIEKGLSLFLSSLPFTDRSMLLLCTSSSLVCCLTDVLPGLFVV